MASTNVFYPTVPSRAKIQQASKGISVTEWFVVFSLAMSGLLLSDPFYGGNLGRSSFAKGVTIALLTCPWRFT